MTTTNHPANPQFRWLLWVVIAGLLGWFYQRQPRYDLHTFQTPVGWGYQISRSDVPLIYQPTVPGRPGRRGFPTEAHARRVGERMLTKVRRGQFPPTPEPGEIE